MKYIITLIALICGIQASAQRCGTTEYTLNNTVAQFGGNKVASPADGRDTITDEVIVIPVVVHVLYNKSIENISDAQILSQIEALNQDYRRTNKDAANTPLPFRKAAADTRIVFCLAKVDPQGRPTTGIVRKFTKEPTFLADDAMKFSSRGGDDAWDATKYLNIWVCNLFGRTLGYAVLPGSPANKDGVVIKYNVFGTTGTVTAPYNKGRTATHEIGHWLGLRHLWGDADCGDDGIADTPPQQTSNSHCTTFPHVSACSVNEHGDMFMNFMDFSDDACMNMFTYGQKTAMRSLFAKSGSKNSFLNANVCDSSNAVAGPLPEITEPEEILLSVYPNPFVNEIIVTGNNSMPLSGKKVKVFGATGKLFYSQVMTTQKLNIRTDHLPAGMYLIRVEGESKTMVYKLIKQSKK